MKAPIINTAQEMLKVEKSRLRVALFICESKGRGAVLNFIVK